MKRLLLIDGSNMLFRAYYAVPAHLSTSSGQPTNAVYGFITMLTKLMSRRSPDFAAVIFDPPGPSFRAKTSATYKANRAKMPEDLSSQVALVEEAVKAFRFPLLKIDEFEADDVIATLTRRAERAGHEVLIVSADKDFSQLLSSKVSMLDGMRDLTYTPELVQKKFGVTPEQFVDFQALCGDKIDNIPGVPGIGQKTAAKLLDDYQSLDQIFEHLQEIGGKTARLLEEHREDAMTSRKLAQLDAEVDLALSWEDLVYQEPEQTELNELYRDMEFYSLLKSTDSDQSTRDSEANQASLNHGTESLDSSWTGAQQVVWEGIWARSGSQPKLAGAVLLRQSDQAALYLEATEESQLPWRDFFSNFQGQLLVSDAKQFCAWLLEQEVEAPAKLFDVRTASYLLDPAKGLPHDLDKLSKIHLHRVLSNEDEVLGKGKKRKDWGDLSSREKADWLTPRAEAVLELAELFQDELKSQGLVAHAQNEIRLSRVLALMERRGIRVDKAGLETLSEDFNERLSSLQQKIYELAGSEFNVASPKQLAKVLFEDLGLPVIKKTKTGYSTNAEVLDKLAEDHEIAQVLLSYRKFEKLVSTYVDVLLRELAKSGSEQRVHCSFGQTVSTTGRLITSDPDLQRTPVRTPEGKQIRRLFQPEPGWSMLVADWSQIELRILAHLCQDPVLVEAFQTEQDIHKRTASELFDKSEDQVTVEERDVAKTVNFATIYGQGASALAQNLNLTKKKAEEIIERYFQVYAGVKSWIEQTIDQAKVTGRVTTLAGRTRFIPELFSKNTMVYQAGERMAVNTPVQGSAADLCKKVMLDLQETWDQRPELKSRLLLQVHDELVYEVPPEEIDEVKSLVQEAMENVWKLSVPLKVSIGVGPSWEEAKA